MNIELDELEAIFNKLVKYARENGQNTFELKDDYYWHIFAEQKYNPYESPTELTLGQLYDDWYNLKKILEDEEDNTIMYHFVWLAAIIRYVGENR